MDRLRHHGDLLSLPVDLDHPVVQPSVRVPHNVVQNDKLLELLPERLLERRGPHEISGSRCLGLEAVLAVVAVCIVLPSRAAVVGPSALALPVGICCPKTREVLVRPWVFSQKDIRILEALEKDLEAARLGRQRLALPREVVAVPEGVVEGFGREVDDVGVRNEVGSQLGVEDVGCGFADVGKIGDEAASTS